MVTKRICYPDSRLILDDILQRLSNAETCQTKRRMLIEAVLKSLQRAKVTTNHVDSIVNRIVIEFPQCAKKSLLQLVDFCLASIQNNDDDYTSWKEILPLLLETLKGEKYITYKGSEMSGTEYKAVILKSISHSNWDSKLATSLAKMFREMSLEKNDLEIVMKALCERLLASEPNEIPPLVHQLLLLSDDSRLLLNTLYKYFSQKYAEAALQESSESYDMIEKISVKEVQDVESTVLYHIHQAVQVDQKILKDFIRSLRSLTNAPEFVLDSFVISVLLLNADLFENQVFEVLRLSIARKCQEEERNKNSAWLRMLSTNDWRVIDIIGEVIKNSNVDRPLILKRLVEFAFNLMDIEKKLSYDETPLWEIGAKIIQKIARKVHESGPTILQLLYDRIMTNGSSVSQYTDCLSYLCRKMTWLILDSQIVVVSLLEQLLSMPGNVAMQVLYAVLPLLKLSQQIRDTLVLVLRKSLTKRDTHTRQMAVLGFLQLLKNLKVSSLSALSQGNSSSSSTSASSSSILTQATLEKYRRNVPQDPKYNMSLCQELLSILSRCFMYDHQVRLYLYEGLYDAIIFNPELTEYVIDILLEHFLMFYEPDEDILPPIVFVKCTATQGAEEVLQEPLGELVFLMQKLYIKTALKNYAAVNQLAMILESLCKRMSQTEAEHLSLNEAIDLLDNVPKAQRTLHNLKLTISVYEALIAYRFGAWSKDSVNVAQSVSSLFKAYLRFADFLKKSHKTKKGDAKKTDKDVTDKNMIRKNTRAVTLKLPNTVMDVPTVYRMLLLLYETDLSWASKEQADILRKRTEFHQYALQTCLQLVRNAKSLKSSDLKRHKDQYSKTYLQIGRLLFKKVVSRLNDTQIFDPISAVFALECFKELCDLMCNSLTSELPKFLSFIGNVNMEEDLNSQIQGLLPSLKVALNLALDEEEDEDLIMKKIPLYLIETISHLIHKVSFEDNKNGGNIQDWLKNEAALKNVEPSVCLIIIQLMLFVDMQTTEHASILRKICEDLSEKSNEGNQSNTGEFEIINEHTFMQIYSVVNNTMKSKLNNVVWFFGRLKAEQTAITTPGMLDEDRRTNLRSKERSLCYQLSDIVGLLDLLVKTDSDPGSHTDAVLKNIQQTFNMLSNLTKYFISKSTVQNVAFESTKFNQLVELAGRTLKPHVESFMSNIEDYSRSQNKSNDMNARRNKILRETKVIPRVIYEIEQFNKDILNLSKKSGIELNKHIKLSATKDFRINKIQVVENLEKVEMSMLTTQNTTHIATRARDHDGSVMSERSAESESEVTPSKRRRLNSSSES